MMNAKIKKFLKKLEWSGYQQGQGSGFMSSGGDGRHYPACPICTGIKPGSGSEGDFNSSIVGHQSRCQMKSILKELEKE